MWRQLAELYHAESAVTVVSVDVDRYGELKNMYDVSILPTLKMFAYVAEPLRCAGAREIG